VELLLVVSGIKVRECSDDLVEWNTRPRWTACETANLHCDTQFVGQCSWFYVQLDRN